MAITSVNSATSSLTQQQVANRQPRESQEARQVSMAVRTPEQPLRPQRSEATPSPERNAQSRPIETPQPFVNAQGQKTGSIINTTA